MASRISLYISSPVIYRLGWAWFMAQCISCVGGEVSLAVGSSHWTYKMDEVRLSDI